MGDPAGVGPEICLHLLASEAVHRLCRPVIFGDAAVLARCAHHTGLPAPKQVITRSEWPVACRTLTQSAVLDLAAIDAAALQPGTVNAATGLAGYRFIEAAIQSALAGEVHAVATAPINKEALHAAGFKYPGHTEIFAEQTKATRACMMLTSPELTCSFVTVHVGYRDVPGLLTIERVLEVIELTAAAMRLIRGRAPKLVICGLNPHAGEHGLFGDREEERIIVPAVEAARARGITIEGPLPPDTAFLARRRRETDAFVCMYHDQGHIPLKALAFDDAINITLGLSIIRTSVDHGTACDIAWQGKANPNSLFEAVKLATQLAAGRTP
jgi:4-hydroxythreonine-4-phosphate dehydrogenase